MRGAAACLALVLVGCTAAETPPAGILLLTLDTTRADRLSAWGHAQPTTPRIDRLARDGIVFESAVSAAPITLPAHASILSGVEPPVHGVRNNGIFVLGPEATLVPEVLQRHGWRTAAFVGSYVLDPRFGLDQGFEVYSGPEPSASGPVGVFERPADAVVGDALAWLRELGPGERFFVWVHLFDPHRPWQAPAPWSQRFADPYDAEIAFVDAQIDRLLDGLQRQGRDRDLLVALTADHGESLGEHGEESHGVFVYQATQHVPLLLWGAPVAASAGLRVPHPVSNTDLAPTLLELAGLGAALPELQGRSLLARDGRPAPQLAERPLYLESFLPYYSFGWHALRGLVWRGHKLVEGKAPELYDLSEDPAETRDLARERPETLAEMRSRLARLEAGFAPGDARVHPLDPAETELLEALGYVDGRFGGDPLDPELADPRERLADRHLYDRAEQLVLEAGGLLAAGDSASASGASGRERARVQLRAAREMIEQVLEKSPNDIPALHVLADAEALLGRWGASAAALERVVRLDPGNDLAHFALGVAYFETGRPAEGAREVRRAIELEPRQARYPLELARRFVRAGDAEQSRVWLERAASLVPVDSAERREIERMSRDLEARSGSDA